MPFALAFVLAGCGVTPEPLPEPPEMPAAFASAQSEAVPTHHVAPWWRRFDDPALTRTVETVLSGNLDLAEALVRLREAGALRDALESDLFPVVDGFADTGASGSTGGAQDSAGRISLTSGLSIDYDPDLAGGNRLRLEEALARFEAAGFGVEEARRLVSEAAALQYIAYRRAGARLELLETSLDLQARTVEIVTARFEAGLSPALDVDRAAADLARTQAERGILEADRRRAGYGLAVLAGAFPGSFDIEEAGETVIPRLSEAPAAGLPRDLLRNRPDVQRAERRLIAELAALGAERADLLPSLSLPGQISLGASDLTDSADPVARLTVSALLDIPIFDRGRRQAEIRIQRARADAALLQWRSRILSAVADVENRLVEIAALESRLDRLEEAVASSENAYRQLDALYREGLATFIDVLDAQRTLISNREAVLAARADLAIEQVRLGSALGLADRSADPSS
jgi:NodT family efflux transporter outer membrane factor (OMF) lipoprotein